LIETKFEYILWAVADAIEQRKSWGPPAAG
jgi:hypothetical protein